MIKTEIDPFWTWVCAQPDHNDPRGDFIRDTRDLVRGGVDPGTRIVGGSLEARAEHDRLRREYDRI